MKNRLFRIGCWVALALLLPVKVMAQFDAHFNNYWELKGFYNPSWAGQTGKLNLTGTYSMQLTAFKRAPKVMYFGADMPFQLGKRRHGVGLSFMNNTLGLFSRKDLGAQYAFLLKLGKGKLSVGAQIGFTSVTYDPKKLDLGEGDAGNDPAFPTAEQNAMGLDLGFGAMYVHPDFYVSLSGAHITGPTLELSEASAEGNGSSMRIRPMLYLMGAYNIRLANPLLKIQPSVLLQSDLNRFRADITGRVIYTYQERSFFGGLTYSPDISLTASLGATIKGVTFGYAYEFFTSGIGVASGNHEIFIRYAMDLNLFKKGKNKHKSIRIL